MTRAQSHWQTRQRTECLTHEARYIQGFEDGEKAAGQSTWMKYEREISDCDLEYIAEAIEKACTITSEPFIVNYNDSFSDENYRMIDDRRSNVGRIHFGFRQTK